MVIFHHEVDVEEINMMKQNSSGINALYPASQLFKAKRHELKVVNNSYLIVPETGDEVIKSFLEEIEKMPRSLNYVDEIKRHYFQEYFELYTPEDGYILLHDFLNLKYKIQEWNYCFNGGKKSINLLEYTIWDKKLQDKANNEVFSFVSTYGLLGLGVKTMNIIDKQLQINGDLHLKQFVDPFYYFNDEIFSVSNKSHKKGGLTEYDNDREYFSALEMYQMFMSPEAVEMMFIYYMRANFNVVETAMMFSLGEPVELILSYVEIINNLYKVINESKNKEPVDLIKIENVNIILSRENGLKFKFEYKDLADMIRHYLILNLSLNTRRLLVCPRCGKSEITSKMNKIYCDERCQNAAKQVRSKSRKSLYKNNL
jgi:hypothetical protein